MSRLRCLEARFCDRPETGQCFCADQRLCSAPGLMRSMSVTADAASTRDKKRLDLAAGKIGLLSSPGSVAAAAEKMLRRRYDFADHAQAETIVALGGDGFMLHTLHRMLEGAAQ